MATQAVTSGVEKVNGATIVKAGNVPSTATRCTNVQTLRENTLRVKNTTTPVYTSGSNIGTHEPLFGGTFGYNPPSNISSSTGHSVVAKRVSTTLSGKSDTSLQSGASDTSARQSSHWSRGDRVYSNTNAEGATYDVLGGGFTAGTTRKAAGTFVGVSGIDGGVNYDADHTVLNSTFAVPGELVWIETGKTPSQKDYAAKYGT